MNNMESLQNQQTGGAGRLFFVAITLTLLSVVVGGLFWIFALSPNSPVGLGWFIFSFAAGLSMIVLPCTLPLAFVIVPMVMGKSYGKGLATALSFSAGVALTLSTYGILAALLGKALFGFAGGSGETIKSIFYVIAGIFAIVFALGELGVLKVRMPSYSGAVPEFIQRRKDIFKPFLLGLFLGNIGVGCPHPATPMILGQIGIIGDVFYGWLLFFVHALGRVVPLIVLAMFGVLGINATKSLVKHREVIAKATAWGMVYVGAFLFILGFFGHAWWVYSGQHSLFEVVTQEERFTTILAERVEIAPAHTHGLEELTGKNGLFGAPLWLGNWALVALWVLPLWWYWFREKRRARTLLDPQILSARLSVLRFMGAFFLSLSLLIALVFGYTISEWFLKHKGLEAPSMAGLKSQVIFETFPVNPIPGEQAQLIFSFKNEVGDPLSGLKIEHERILHVQVVSADFQVFSHIHPDDAGPITPAMLAAARFELPYTFPQGGEYLVVVGYLHASHDESKTFRVRIGSPAETMPPMFVKDLRREKFFDNYKVALSSEPSNILAGDDTTLRYNIEKEGSPITDLETYLAAPIHLAIVSVDLSSYEHTHGEIHDKATGIGRHELFAGELFGPEIEVHTVFPFPGLYQIFGEFRHQGNVIISQFLVEVAAKKGEFLQKVQGH